MEIMVDNEQIQQAVNDNINTAIIDAMGGYSVRAAIAEKLTEQVVSGAVGQALDVALTKIDSTRLVTALAEQIERSVTAAVVHVIRESMIDLLIRIRNVPDYDREQKEKVRAEIRAKMEW